MTLFMPAHRSGLAGRHLAPILLGSALYACACAAAIAQAAPDTPPATTSTLIYDANALANVRGGVQRGSDYQGMLRWQTGIDAARAWGWSNTSAYVNVMATHHAGPAVLTGDAQGVSNIAAPSGVRVEEAWLQRSFMEGRLSALVGRYDLNSEFYRLASAGLFFNSSFGVGPEFSASGQGGPSIFPATSLGVRLEYKPAPNVVMRAAVLDGVPVDRTGGGTGAFRGGDGVLVVYELAWMRRPAVSGRPPDRRFLIGRASGLDPYQDKIAVGGWHYTADFDDLSARNPGGLPLRRQGSSGAYLIADRLLYASTAPAPRKIAGFVQLGLGDARVNRFGAYLGMGVVATGLLPARASDEVGLAVAIARNGNHYLLGQQDAGPAPQRAEATVELTYLSQLTPHVSLQPNLQYVIHPDTVTGTARALTLQLRAEIAF
jgi:porin